MCMTAERPGRPSWDRLYEAAVGQEGHFTTEQAAEAGYSPQLLVHHVRAEKGVKGLVILSLFR